MWKINPPHMQRSKPTATLPAGSQEPASLSLTACAPAGPTDSARGLLLQLNAGTKGHTATASHPSFPMFSGLQTGFRWITQVRKVRKNLFVN